MSIRIAARVFEELNQSVVQVIFDKFNGSITIRSSVAPKYLIYPEGWYYANGKLRNKHMSTSGLYEEALMETVDGILWSDVVDYCTLDD